VQRPHDKRVPRGARCGKTARRDLWRGQGVTPGPTLTLQFSIWHKEMRAKDNQKRLKTKCIRFKH
jgi:hypothetical protein